MTSDASGSRIRFQSAVCGTCQGCGSRIDGFPDIAGPPLSGTQVDATMTTNSLIAVLAHSFGLPIAGFVGGATVALLGGMSEGVAVLLSLLGFSAGCFFCRQQQTDRIQIAEVTNE